MTGITEESAVINNHIGKMNHILSGNMPAGDDLSLFVVSTSNQISSQLFSAQSQLH
ncbi:hypothetical protein SDC9_123401 [bioreactor metagenome]|uniref:Uncharacterized protein n=1 Tax=bioreactor metagenome TaxID=1076179 RepID=A0A645CHI2_9ZZZZ